VVLLLTMKLMKIINAGLKNMDTHVVRNPVLYITLMVKVNGVMKMMIGVVFPLIVEPKLKVITMKINNYNEDTKINDISSLLAKVLYR